MKRHRPFVHRITLGLAVASLTGLACSGMRAEKPVEPAASPSTAQAPRDSAPMAAEEATAAASPVREAEVVRARREATSRAARASKSSSTERGFAADAAGVGNLVAPAKKGRRGPPPAPAWMQQGDSAPGGDFEGRAARVNDFTETSQDHLSTFAVDVDTAAYSIARRTLKSNRMPTPSLVRVEEVLNYFEYDYPAPKSPRELFSISADGAESPVHGNRHLLRVGIQAKALSQLTRKPLNLVFLVDTSGSMQSRDKLGLTKTALAHAVDQLDDRDRVAITTYAGGVRLVLPPTSGANKHEIKAALRRLRSGGGTAMSSGLELAYREASKMLRDDAVTRIIVCSDGDANIGAARPDEILERIGKYVSEGVFLSTIGFGHGNYKDAMMEKLANKGNGNYFYIDSERQAERVFARDFIEMVQDVAQDVKIQVDMNPEAVASYRLVGYENRDVADRDFRNDAVDAGEIGAGHQVTALYEVVLREQPADRLATVRVRAKKPRGTVAKEVAFDVQTRMVTRTFESAPEDLRFAVAAMGSAELMRRSPHAEGWSYAKVIEIISGTRPYDEPDRAELLSLMKRAALLRGEARPVATR